MRAGVNLGILLFFVIFFVIVLSHELGHFLLAKANGISVVEFSIGMGPCLVSFSKGGTKYAIRLLPIGGACMFEGEDGKGLEDEEDQTEAEELVKETSFEKGSIPFPKAGIMARFLTLVAGPGFNFILAFIMSVIIIASIGVDLPTIGEVQENGAASEAGLMAGDQIISLNGKKVHLYRDISLFSMLYEGGDIQVVYERDGKINQVVLTPKYDDEAKRYYMGIIGYNVYTKMGAFDTVRYSGYEVKYWIDTTIKSLEMLVRGKVSRDDVSGPVGMAQTVNTIYTESKPDGAFYIWLNMLNFAILLSANLGVLNLLPLPALDGGRIVFVIVEAIRRKPIPPEKEGLVHMIGFVALMLLMVFVFYNDLSRIF